MAESARLGCQHGESGMENPEVEYASARKYWMVPSMEYSALVLTRWTCTGRYFDHQPTVPPTYPELLQLQPDHSVGYC